MPPSSLAHTRNIIVHYDAEANVSNEVFSIDSTNNASYVAQGIGISGNGRYITFALRSPTTFNGSNFTQILAIDRNNPGQITVASGGSFGFGNGNSSWPKVSDDGHVLFMTNAGNLTGDFANSASSALVVRDLQSSELTVASRRPNGTTIAILCPDTPTTQFRAMAPRLLSPPTNSICRAAACASLRFTSHRAHERLHPFTYECRQ